MLNWFYKLIMRWMGRQPPRQTSKKETAEALRLREKYKKWGKE